MADSSSGTDLSPGPEKPMKLTYSPYTIQESLEINQSSEITPSENDAVELESINKALKQTQKTLKKTQDNLSKVKKEKEALENKYEMLEKLYKENISPMVKKVNTAKSITPTKPNDTKTIISDLKQQNAKLRFELKQQTIQFAEELEKHEKKLENLGKAQDQVDTTYRSQILQFQQVVDNQENEINELRAKLEAEKASKLSSNQELDTVKKELEALKASLKQKDEEISKYKTEKGDFNQAHMASINSLANEKKNLEDELGKARETIKTLNAKVTELDSKNQMLEKTVTHDKGILKDYEDQLTNLTEQMVEFSFKEQSYIDQIKSLKKSAAS